MLFEKAADGRLLTTYWISLVAGSVLALYLLFDTASQVVRFDAEFAELWVTPKFLAVSILVAALFSIAFMTTASKYRERYRVKELIDRMITLFEEGCVGDEGNLIVTYNGPSGIAVSVSRRLFGSYHVIVSTDRGIQRHLVVQRYRIDLGENAGTLLPLSEMNYVHALVRFLSGQHGLASEVTAIENDAPLYSHA